MSSMSNSDSDDYFNQEIYPRERAEKLFPDAPNSGVNGGITQHDLDLYGQQLDLYDRFIPQDNQTEGQRLLAQGTQIILGIKQQIIEGDDSPIRTTNF